MAMRLIDADRLLTEGMMSKYYHLPNGDIAIPIIDIKHAKTIDAVEIVRCENCKHKYRREYADGMVELSCQKTYDFNGFAAEVEPNHFCSYGERETDETD